MTKLGSFIIIICFCSLGAVHAQNETLGDVHLFQTFFNDAAAPTTTYGEGVFGFSNFDGANVINLGVRAGFPINEQFTVGGGIAFLNADPDVGNGESGISDLRMVGIYHLPSRSATIFSVGGFLTLPIGKDELGQGEASFGAFGAVRHPVARQTVITGTLGLEFLKGAPVEAGGWPGVGVGANRETALLLGGGVVHQVTGAVSLVGELNFRTEGDFALLTGGVDYELASGGRLRGGLGIGVDDGAPDVSILLGYLHSFR
ncbi:MAG TPA: hypothetical protein VGA99_01115 [bacterium]